jgi:hypothetical protein
LSIAVRCARPLARSCSVSESVMSFIWFGSCLWRTPFGPVTKAPDQLGPIVEPNELVIEPKVVPRGRAPGVTAMLARPVLSNRLGSDAVQPVRRPLARRLRAKSRPVFDRPGLQGRCDRLSLIRAPIATGCRNGSMGGLDRDPGGESGPRA